MDFEAALNLVCERAGFDPVELELAFARPKNNVTGVDNDIARQQATMAGLAMLFGNKTQAIRCVEQAFELGTNQVKSVNALTPLSMIFAVRTANTLERNGMTCVGHLLNSSRALLMTMDNIAENEADKIESRLADFGLKLGN